MDGAAKARDLIHRRQPGPTWLPTVPCPRGRRSQPPRVSRKPAHGPDQPFPFLRPTELAAGTADGQRTLGRRRTPWSTCRTAMFDHVARAHGIRATRQAIDSTLKRGAPFVRHALNVSENPDDPIEPVLIHAPPTAHWWPRHAAVTPPTELVGPDRSRRAGALPARQGRPPAGPGGAAEAAQPAAHRTRKDRVAQDPAGARPIPAPLLP